MHKIFSNLKGFVLLYFTVDGFDDFRQHYSFLSGDGIGSGTISNEIFSFGDGDSSGDGCGNGAGNNNRRTDGCGNFGDEHLILFEEYYA